MVAAQALGSAKQQSQEGAMTPEPSPLPAFLYLHRLPLHPSAPFWHQALRWVLIYFPAFLWSMVRFTARTDFKANMTDPLGAVKSQTYVGLTEPAFLSHAQAATCSQPAACGHPGLLLALECSGVLLALKLHLSCALDLATQVSGASSVSSSGN